MDILVGKLYRNICCYTSELIYEDDELMMGKKALIVFSKKKQLW